MDQFVPLQFQFVSRRRFELPTREPQSCCSPQIWIQVNLQLLWSFSTNIRQKVNGETVFDGL